MKRGTHLEFIAEVKILHPNLVVLGKYTGVYNKVMCENEYGKLLCNPRDLLRNKGVTIVSAINKVEYLYNETKNLYGSDYKILGEYNGARTHILVQDKYGKCLSMPTNLLRGKKFGINSAVDKNEYMKAMFREIHGDRYDYSESKYINASKNVIITCPIHGKFKQLPAVHLRGCGCKKCACIAVHNIQRDTLESFIKKATLVHGDKYDYSEAVYVDSATRIKIYCKIHKIYFWQQPNNHLTGNECPQCYRMGLRLRFARCTSDFINESKKIHNNKFDYSKSEYVNSDTKVCIICPIHGEFWQRPSSHLQGHGCEKCVDRSILGGYSRSDFIRVANGSQCTLYKVEMKESNGTIFYKIGITKNDVRERFYHSNIKYKYKIISTTHGEAGVIWDMELREHRRHKMFEYKPLLHFGGETECFSKLI